MRAHPRISVCAIVCDRHRQLKLHNLGLHPFWVRIDVVLNDLGVCCIPYKSF